MSASAVGTTSGPATWALAYYLFTTHLKGVGAAVVGLTGTALAPRRRHTSRSVIIVGWRGLGGASQLPQPHLKDGSVYRPLRPTTAYGRYHHLRDVARQAFDAPRSLDSRSVTCMGRGYGRSAMLALGWTAGGTIFEMWLGNCELSPRRSPAIVVGRGRATLKKGSAGALPPPLTFMPPPFPASLFMASGS